MRSPFLPHSALKLQGKINRMMRKLQVSVLLVSCIVAICAIFVQPKSAHACLVAPCPYKFTNPYKNNSLFLTDRAIGLVLFKLDLANPLQLVKLDLIEPLFHHLAFLANAISEFWIILVPDLP